MRYRITLRAEWVDLKSKLKSRFPELAEVDFKPTPAETMDHLQRKLGKCRQEFIRMLNRL